MPLFLPVPPSSLLWLPLGLSAPGSRVVGIVSMISGQNSSGSQTPCSASWPQCVGRSRRKTERCSCQWQWSLPRMMKNKGDGIDTSWLRWWLYCLELNRGGNKSVLSLTGMTRGVCKAHVSSTQFSVLTISHLPSSSTSEVVCECKEKWHSPLKDKLTKLICFTCSQTPDSSTAS